MRALVRCYARVVDAFCAGSLVDPLPLVVLYAIVNALSAIRCIVDIVVERKPKPSLEPAPSRPNSHQRGEGIKLRELIKRAEGAKHKEKTSGLTHVIDAMLPTQAQWQCSTTPCAHCSTLLLLPGQGRPGH